MSEGMSGGKPVEPGPYSVQYMGRWWRVQVIEDESKRERPLLVLGLPGFGKGRCPPVEDFKLWSVAGDFVSASCADILSPSDRAIARLVAAYQHAQRVNGHKEMDALQEELLSSLGEGMVHLRQTLGNRSVEIPAIKEQIQWWGFMDREAVHARVKTLEYSENMHEAQEAYIRSREASAKHAHDIAEKMEAEQKRRDADEQAKREAAAESGSSRAEQPEDKNPIVIAMRELAKRLRDHCDTRLLGDALDMLVPLVSRLAVYEYEEEWNKGVVDGTGQHMYVFAVRMWDKYGKKFLEGTNIAG